MKHNLYIMTHKKTDIKYAKDRKLMLVGAVDKEKIDGYYYDYASDRENISAKNKNYCELTGLYYAFKNDECDILSLEHYRRIFVRTKFYFFKYPFYQTKHIEKIMKNYDIIMPKKTLFKNNILEEYSIGHYKDDMLKVGEIIKKDCPKYIDAFNEVMQGKYTYLLNMFIGKKYILDGYCEWLFNILFKLEKLIDITDRSAYQQRVFGFLSERLFTVYLCAHKEIKVYEATCQMIYKNPIYDNGYRIIGRIKRLFKKIFLRKKNSEEKKC